MTDYSAKNPTKKRVVVPAGMTSPRNITAPAASEWPADNMDSRPHEGPSVPANESQGSQENGSEDEPEEAGLSDRMKKIAKGSSTIPSVIYAQTLRVLPQNDAERWQAGMPIPESKFGTLFLQPLRQFINANTLKMHISRVIPTVLSLKTPIIVWTSLDHAEVMGHASARTHTTVHQALGNVSPQDPLQFCSLSLEEVQEHSVGCSYEIVREQSQHCQVLFCLDKDLQELRTLAEPHSSEDILLQTVGMCMRVKRWRGFSRRYAKCLILRSDYLYQSEVAANMGKWLYQDSGDVRLPTSFL